VSAIHGPNDNSREFYADLTKILTELNCENVVVGGDWNSTWDRSPPENNLDILNMVNLPSRYRSEQVHQLALRFELIEPFRFLFPSRRDYTYIPNAQANMNRSRIDYFLITSNLISEIVDTEIQTGRLSTLFDHKSANLNLGKKIISIDRNKICNGILDNKIIELTITVTVKEYYLNNADPAAVPIYITNPIRYEIGRIHNLLKIATDLELSGTLESEVTDDNRIEIQRLVQLASDIAETLPTLEFFENFPLVVNPAIFFEGLIMSVKNETLSKQSTIYKIKNHRKKILRDRINFLKKI
jgi:hypothetical protein